MENWRPIPGLDGYEVSDQGRVRSLIKAGFNGRTKRDTPKILSIATRTNGYPYVSFYGGKKVRDVHGLVLLAFVGPRQKGQEARHLNGCKTDSRLENLCWGTHRENEADRVRHGTIPRGSKHPTALLNEDQVQTVFAFSRYMPQTELAKIFGVSQTEISAIKTGKIWKAMNLKPQQYKVYEIDEEGIHGLWDDNICSGIGKVKKIRRASDVEPTSDGKWIVRLKEFVGPRTKFKTSKFLGGDSNETIAYCKSRAKRFERREDAIAAEIALINRLILKGDIVK